MLLAICGRSTKLIKFYSDSLLHWYLWKIASISGMGRRRLTEGIWLSQSHVVSRQRSHNLNPGNVALKKVLHYSLLLKPEVGKKRSFSIQQMWDTRAVSVVLTTAVAPIHCARCLSRAQVTNLASEPQVPWVSPVPTAHQQSSSASVSDSRDSVQGPELYSNSRGPRSGLWDWIFHQF